MLSSNGKLCYYVDPTMKKMKGSLDMTLCSNVIAGERCKCKWHVKSFYKKKMLKSALGNYLNAIGDANGLGLLLC